MLEYIDARQCCQTAPIGALRAGEREYLRDLARRVAEIGRRDIQKERIHLWKEHNALRRPRPMVLCFPEAAWLEILPWKDMRVQDPFWRSYEWTMRRMIYRDEHLPDDFVIEPLMEVPLVYRVTPLIEGMGSMIHTAMEDDGSALETPKVLSDERGSEQLLEQRLLVDEATTRRNLQAVGDLLQGVLPAALNPLIHIDTSLLRAFMEMRGAEQMLYDLYDSPEWVHEILGRMCDQSLRLLDQVEKQYLARPNTGCDYVGSGGIGYTDEILPEAGKAPTLKNCWGFSDAQELAGVSPAMYDEFATAYHEKMLARFGLACYGCCEPLGDKIENILRRVKNLRRISVNPWTDRESVARAIGRDAIFSWKPNPAFITSRYQEKALRDDIRATMEIAGDCSVEMIMKDTHTIGHEPRRLSDWIALARDTALEGYKK